MSHARILVVEDEAVIATEVANRLESLGYEVAAWVMSGEDALSTVSEDRPDLVLMDIHLSGTVDGIEAAERIHDDHDIPVVYLTAYGDDDTLHRATVTDPFGFILKPFSERDLRTAIEVALYKHRIRATLIEREQWLATTLSSIGDAVLATDTAGLVTYLNPVAEELTGWSLEDARGRPFGDVFVVEKVSGGDAIEVPLHEIVKEKEAVRITEDAALVRRDGGNVPIVDDGAPLVVTPIEDGSGAVFGAVLVFSDISPKKTSEEEIRSLNESLRDSNRNLEDQKRFLGQLFETVPSPVVVIGDDRRITMANRSFRSMFAAADDDMFSLPVGQVLGCATATANPNRCGTLEECASCGVNGPILDALEGRATDGKRCSFLRTVGGETSNLTFLNSAAPLEFEGRHLAILILEDITELSGLRRLLGSERSFAGIVGTSPKMLDIFDTIRDIADLAVPVMILGESGTGKELVARAIHTEGSRSRGSFVPVNCGALPDGLLESELFGHVKGAFTGAVRDRKGRFELADGGTIFLDEIGDLSPAMQVKLLRVLQEGTFEKVGSEKTLTSDARVICATNRDLESDVRDGRFRDDLFYRLCVMPITVPPLRDRLEDVPLIAQHLVEKENASSGGRMVQLSPDVLSSFMGHSWPGNVRELQNAITYAFIKSKGGTIEPRHLPPALSEGSVVTSRTPNTRSGLTTAAVEDALERTGDNKVQAAKLLGVSRATLYRFLSDHPALKGE